MVVEGKNYLHSGSQRNKLRPDHVAMDGVVMPKADRYKLDGADGFTYDPDVTLPTSERINCHCISQPIVDEDI